MQKSYKILRTSTPFNFLYSFIGICMYKNNETEPHELDIIRTVNKKMSTHIHIY